MQGRRRSASAASTSSRFVSDFDPGSASTADSSTLRRGAPQSSVSVCLASPYGSNSGSEYFEISIGYQSIGRDAEGEGARVACELERPVGAEVDDLEWPVMTADETDTTPTDAETMRPS